MDWLVSLSPTLKLALTLLTVVSLMRSGAFMGLALVAGAIVLGATFPMPLGAFCKTAGAGLVSDDSIFLILIVVGILVFSSALHSTGQIDRIIESFRAMVGASRSALVVFPALIGLLPMPGGAIFSAPMVEAASKGSNLQPARATTANYWFRHIWEYWFPVYPGVILALSLTGAPTGKFIAMELPMTFFSVAAGYVVLLRGIRLGTERHRDFSSTKLGRFFTELTPILIVVAVVVLLDPLAEALARRAAPDNMLLRRFPILLGLDFGFAWLSARRGLTDRVLGGLLLKKSVLDMIFLVLGICVFKAVLNQCGAVEDLREEFLAHQVPLAAAVGLLPFVCGIVVGIAVGFVGASFPLVIALLADLPEGAQAPYLFLAYSMGYIGMMLSPVHACLLLTNQYFKSRMLRVYGYLLPLGLSSAMFCVALFYLYRWLQGGP
jgi:hypothetical protein